MNDLAWRALHHQGVAATVLFELLAAHREPKGESRQKIMAACTYLAATFDELKQR